MNTIVKDKMQREIMVVKNSILFNNNRKDGFLEKSNNFEEIILENYEFMVRWEAEKNFDYKQPIPYGVVVSEDNKIFVYKRGGSGSNAWESRLHSKISLWVGGHIERSDITDNNLLLQSLLREVEEETKISHSDIKSAEPFGYINDDSNEVWMVHFWIAYIIKVSTKEIRLEDGELENGEFLSSDEIDSLVSTGDYDMENWSKILYGALKNYLS